MTTEAALRLQLAAADQEIERLRQRVADLEAMYVERYHPPDAWGLTAGERNIVSVLMANRIETSDQLVSALRYLGRYDEPSTSLQSVCVRLVALRRKLAPFGITIENIYGVGYSMKGMVK